ncbi:hypothetical protein TNCV_4572871 [Trichonephila clavipes]|nr:hypothetical protein TNCV_4572871 [Trichonephila clavipes]
MCVQPQSWQKKDILELAQSSKNIIDLDSEDETEMNLMPSEMMNIKKKTVFIESSAFEQVVAIRSDDIVRRYWEARHQMVKKPSTDIG